MMEYKGIISHEKTPKDWFPYEIYFSFKDDEFGNKTMYVWTENGWIKKRVRNDSIYFTIT